MNTQKFWTKKKSVLSLLLLAFLSCVTAILALAVKTSRAKADVAFEEIHLEERYSLYTELALPQMKVTVDGTQYDAVALLRFPDNTAVSSEKVVLSKVGEYELVYRAVVQSRSYEKSFAFHVDNELYTCFGDKASAKYETRVYQNGKGEDVPMSGIAVTLSNGSTFLYNKILDASVLTKDDVFIKFFVLPEQIGAIDVNQIRVRLTDIYDPENYVTFTARTNVDRSVNSNATVNASIGQVPTGIELGAPSELHQMVTWNGNTYRVHANSQYGSYLGGQLSFAGTPYYGDITTNSISFYFDYETKVAYHQVGVIADLDDISMFSKPWSGFTTGEVYLSVEGIQFNNTSATIMITELFGEDLTVTDYTDVLPPELTVELGAYTEKTLPQGVLNQKYSVFKATAFDKEGEAQLQTKVYFNYKTDLQTEMKTTDGCFLPTSIGVYTIEYTATDATGNRTVKTLTVSVIADASPLQITLGDNFSEQGVVGERLCVKEYSLENQKGEAYASVKARFSDDGTEMPIDGTTLSFIPLRAGTYKIVYEFGDYVYRFSEEYEVTVLPTEKPYLNCENVVLPEYLVKNSTYVFPTAEAYNFRNGSAVLANVHFMIYEDGGEGKYFADQSDVTVQAEQTATIRYFVVNESQVNDPSKADFTDGQQVTYFDFEIPVVNAGVGTKELEMASLFKTEGSFGVEGTENGISFTTTEQALTDKKASVRFVNDLYLHNFGLKFSFEKPQFPSFSVNLYDSATKEKMLSLSYLYSVGTVRFALNGGEPFAVPSVGAEFEITVDVETMTMVFYNSTKVLLEKTYGGADVQEMVDRKFYFKIEFDDIAESFTLSLGKISNQVLSNAKKDLASPLISNLASPGSFINGDVYDVQTAFAYDVINPNVTFTLKVIHETEGVVSDINGVALDGVDPSVARKLSLNYFGLYTFIYTASDGGSSSNAVIRRTLEVIDVEPPEITLGKATKKYSVGDKITIAKATAYDDQTKELEVKTYYIDPNGQIFSIKGNSFKATKKGTYRVYYYVADAQGNVTFVDYEITVR